MRHLILRGGDSGPNYNAESVQRAQEILKERGLSSRLVIDCSHGNSSKDHNMQPVVFANITNQIIEGNDYIVGGMIESNLKAGRQKFPAPEGQKLRKGESIVDACVDFPTTVKTILEGYNQLKEVV